MTERSNTNDNDQLNGGVLALIARLNELGAMKELAEAVTQAIAPFGMTAAASGLVSGPKAATLDVFHFTTWPEDWVGHYVSCGFLMVDPIPRWARASGVPITWTGLFDRLAPRDPGRQVIEAGKRFGFTEGMAIPMRAHDGSLGLISFGGSRGPLGPSEQAFLTIVGRAAFESAERIEHDGDIGRPAPIVSAREIECIRLATLGHSDREIAGMLGLSERTTRFHLTNARDKFGAGSRAHLAALAVAQGYVSP